MHVHESYSHASKVRHSSTTRRQLAAHRSEATQQAITYVWQQPLVRQRPPLRITDAQQVRTYAAVILGLRACAVNVVGLALWKCGPRCYLTTVPHTV